MTDNRPDYDAAADDSNHMQNCAQRSRYSCTAATLKLVPGGQRETACVEGDVDISNEGLHFRLGRGLMYTPEELEYLITADETYKGETCWVRLKSKRASGAFKGVS